MPPGTGYQLSLTGTTVTDAFRSNSGAVYPYSDPSGTLSITGAINALAGFYYFFFDWKITVIGSYDYLWSNGDTTQTITGLAPNTYSVTVTDALAATTTSNIVTITTVGSPSASTDTRTECSPFTWVDGNTYTTNNNTATFTTSNAAG